MAYFDNWNNDMSNMKSRYLSKEINSKPVKRIERHSNRTAYCYNCKIDLDGSRDKVCLVCGWLICPLCHGCGCDYKGLGK